MFDLRVDGGRVVRPGAEPRVESVGVIDGRIAAVGELGESPARRVLDATGLHVLPGIIDTHFHIGFTSPETEWTTESRSAAIGGVTTLMVYFRSLELYDELLPAFIEQAEAQSVVDFGVHLGILHDGHLERLRHYVERFRLHSIKMYTTYKNGELKRFGILGQDDGFIHDVLAAASTIPDLVVNVHCENDDMVERGRRFWQQPDATPVQQWSNIRPVVAEEDAVRRVALLARETGGRLFIPHVSSERALAAALNERRLGARVAMETCPHYLFAGDLAAAGTLAKVNPPVRTASDAHALWDAVARGHVDTVGTDHATIMRAGKQGDVVDARPGFPGVATLLPALLQGVSQRRIMLGDVARLQENAARIFHLPTKGTVAPGFDADLALVDLEREQTVDAASTGSLSDFTPFHGLTLKGWPVATVRRGEVIAEHGTLTDGAAQGRYVRELTP